MANETPKNPGGLNRFSKTLAFWLLVILVPVAFLQFSNTKTDAAIKLKGCGLLVLNPPWQFDVEAGAIVNALAGHLAQAPGAAGRVQWIVPEP